MIWLGAFSNGITRPVIIAKGIVNHTNYINKIFPIALKDGNKLLGSNLILQQDGATPHTQQQCEEYFANLNPLDYSIWYELCTQMNWDILILNKLYRHIQ